MTKENISKQRVGSTEKICGQRSRINQQKQSIRSRCDKDKKKINISKMGISQKPNNIIN